MLVLSFVQGRGQHFSLGPRLKAESGGGVPGRGLLPPPHQLEICGSTVSSPAGFGEEPRPPKGIPPFSAGWYLRQKPVGGEGGSKTGGLPTLPFPSPPPFHSPYILSLPMGGKVRSSEWEVPRLPPPLTNTTLVFSTPDGLS